MRRLLPAVLTTLLLTSGLVLAGQPAGAAPPAAAASTFTPLSPVRVLDTRDGTGASPVNGGQTRTLDLAARVPATATAVVLNVTGVSPTTATFVTVFPGGAARPTASNLNLAAGDVRANQVTVALGAGRTVGLYNNTGSVHLVADLAGYYSTADGAGFTPVPADRALDTRATGGPLGAGTTRVVDLTGRIPASATAVTFNLTATNPTASTFVTAWPAGAPRPAASSLNVVAGETLPNLVTVTVGANRQVSLYNHLGSVDLLVDLTGFYTPDYGAAFVPTSPTRVLDTRDGTGGTTGPVGTGGYIILDLADRVPASSIGVLLNVTGVEATAQTYVTATTPVGEMPNASTLNVSPGQTVANAADVPFAVSHDVGFYNHAGAIHLVADVAGAFVVADPHPCTTDCVYTWGRRLLGTTGGVYGSAVPDRVAGLSGVRAVTGGNDNSYALRDDGTVWAWGVNFLGELGNGWTSGSAGWGMSAVPVPVVGLTGVTAITAGGGFALALRDDGTVWAWGANWSGQLGNGDWCVPNQACVAYTPVQVATLTDVTTVAGAGENGYAVTGDGSAWAWGVNNRGQLGNGQDCGPNYCVSWEPTRVPITDSRQIASFGNGAYLLRADGTVSSWGANFGGALGTTTVPIDADSKLPVQVQGLPGKATTIGGGADTGYAIVPRSTAGPRSSR